MSNFYNSNNKGRGSNKGRITPESNNRSATISITVNVDLRRMAEALAFLLDEGYDEAGSKSGLGRLCIEAVAMSGRKQGVPECETIEKALQYLRRNGITWTRQKDMNRIGNLLKFETSYLEGDRRGFDDGEYERKPTYGNDMDENRKAYEEAVQRMKRENRERKQQAPDPDTISDEFTDTPSDDSMSDAEIAERRRQKDQAQQDKLKRTMAGLKQQLESNKED